MAAATGLGFTVPELVKRGIQLAGGASKALPTVGAMAGMFALMSKPPDKLEGESDEEYMGRLNAMAAGEDILAPRPRTYNTDEYPKVSQ